MYGQCNRMIDKVVLFIDAQHLIQPNSTIVVGLSGGSDSVCLLHLLLELQPKYNLTLIAAHLDHEWPSTSKDDALFCKQLAKSLNIPFVAAQASKIKQPHYNGSKEEVWRNLRHAFFQSVIKEYEADALALGHHKDDQLETFLVRLIRGASIAGLAGMKPRETIRGIPYIRPLLTCSKDETISYLTKHTIAFVQDQANKSDTFLRNALRLKALPALRSCDSRFDRSFEKTHEHIKQANEFIQRLTQKKLAEMTHSLDGELWLSLEEFFACDPFLHHGIILAWLCAAGVPFTPSTGFFEEIVRFFKNPASEHRPKKSWAIIKKAGQVSIK